MHKLHCRASVNVRIVHVLMLSDRLAPRSGVPISLLSLCLSLTLPELLCLCTCVSLALSPAGGPGEVAWTYPGPGSPPSDLCTVYTASDAATTASCCFPWLGRAALAVSVPTVGLMAQRGGADEFQPEWIGAERASQARGCLSLYL